MPDDPEIVAMGTVAGALADLDTEAQRRVLEWSATKYGWKAPEGNRAPREDGVSPDAQSDIAVYDEFVDLFDAANPEKNGAKALVGAYWFQAVQGQASITSLQVNDILKDVGHGVKEIHKVFDSLQKGKPALVRQMSKSGQARQGRKTYKLTTSGVSEVEKMMKRASSDG
jgi:hypothetical protein